MKSRSVGVLALVAMLVTGCSSTSGTTGQAVSAVSSQASSASTQDSVPKAAKPLADSKVPSLCALLTVADRSDFMVGEPQSDSISCSWKSVDSLNASVVAITSSYNSGGLATTYANAKSGAIKLFQPTAAIDGFPTAIYGLGDSRSTGLCSIAIGINDSSILTTGASLTVHSPKYKDPCSVAMKLAQKVITNLEKAT
jgi:hypothetical protein